MSKTLPITPSRVRDMAARLAPEMMQALMAVPLNAAYVRASPAKAGRLLHIIQVEFADEIHRYGIAVSDTIRDL